MNVQDLQEIVQLMESSGLSEFSLEEENFKLSLKRGMPVNIALPTNSMPASAPQNTQPTVTAPIEDKNTILIKAPMIGTFYAAPSPDSAAFVKVGDVVGPDSVVCILEAMKVMNEVHAECSGEVVEILAKNGDPVEYGQPLFKLKARN